MSPVVDFVLEKKYCDFADLLSIYRLRHYIILGFIRLANFVTV